MIIDLVVASVLISMGMMMLSCDDINAFQTYVVCISGRVDLGNAIIGE